MLALQGSRTEQGIAARMAAMGMSWPPKPEPKPISPEPKQRETLQIDYSNDVRLCNSRGASRHKRRLRELCEEYGVTVAEICGSRGTIKIADARHQIVMRIASEFPAKSLSLYQIGDLIGGRHHTSIMNSLIVTGCPERGYMEKGKRPRYSESKPRGA